MALATPAVPTSLHEHQRPQSQARTNRPSATLAQRLAPYLVLAAATALAALLLHRFLQQPRQLWSDAVHDRHAHFYSGLCLASDVQHLRLKQLVSDLDKLRTWPPLHDGLLVGFTALLSGGDERWAVLPSLLAWVGTAVLAFLLARRCVAKGGTLAGLIAATFVLASPALRAYATDVMLESSGAFLTLLVLYCYLRWRQDATRRDAVRLGIALTAIFLTKYNYWLLLALALTAAELFRNPRAYWDQVMTLLRKVVWRAWLLGQMRHPLTYVLVLLFAVIALVRFTGGTTLTVGGQRLNLHSTANLTTLAYSVLCARVLLAGRGRWRPWLAGLDPHWRALVWWHVVPVAAWFLWPQRLQTFLWYVSPAQAGEHPQYDRWGGYPYYWDCLAGDYHIAVWSLYLACGLLLVTLVAALTLRLRPGAAAVIWLVLIAAILTANHPNRKSRFLHSWAPAMWVGAGAGAACLLNRRYDLAGWSARPVLGAAAVSGLVALHAPGLTAAAFATEGGIHPDAHSILDVTDAYLPWLADERHVAIFANQPIKFATSWTYLQRYGRGERPETDVKGFTPDAPNREAVFAHWLATTPCRRIVLINFAPGSAFDADVPGAAGLKAYGELLQQQSVFRRIHQRRLEEHGCEVSVWQRSSCDARVSASPAAVEARGQ